MTTQMTTLELVSMLFTAMHWPHSEEQMNDVNEIIDDALKNNDTSFDAARLIVDYMDIPRRDNRNLISEVIKPHFLEYHGKETEKL